MKLHGKLNWRRFHLVYFWLFYRNAIVAILQPLRFCIDTGFCSVYYYSAEKNPAANGGFKYETENKDCNTGIGAVVCFNSLSYRYELLSDKKRG
jgi:hypothetical protein